MNCKNCSEKVGGRRVWFGEVGPFCNTECREEYLDNSPAPSLEECFKRPGELFDHTEIEK